MSQFVTAGEIATASLAIIALIGVIGRYLVLVPLKNYIKELTYPIQPNANGGKSLPDVALGIEAIKLRIDGLERRIMRIETRQEDK